MNRLVVSSIVLGVVACGRTPPTIAPAPAPIPERSLPTVEAAPARPRPSLLVSLDTPCTADCPVRLPTEIAQAVETRIAELRGRGGSCGTYAEVLDSSYRRGRIILKPFMWRVGGRLASGAAKTNGEMYLAREIDSLNVGVRTIGDVVLSMEHEAAHIAFRMESSVDGVEDRVRDIVRACAVDRRTGSG